jgi:glutaredoxin
MKIKIYTSPGCSYCAHLKTLLKRANLEWDECVVGQDIPVDQFMAEYPQVKGAPFTVIDGRQYQTVADVAVMLLKEGLVIAPKKD